MTVDKHIRGYIRPSRLMSEAAQRELLTSDAIYVEGKKENRDEAVASLRAGEYLEIALLGLLVPAKHEGNANPIEDLHRTMLAIEARGIIFWEAATGWTSDEPDLRAEMVFEANEFLRKGLKGKHLKGRPPRERSRSEIETMEREYFDLQHPTIPDVVEALAKLGIETNKTWLWRKFRARVKRN